MVAELQRRSVPMTHLRTCRPTCYKPNLKPAFFVETVFLTGKLLRMVVRSACGTRPSMIDSWQLCIGGLSGLLPIGPIRELFRL